ncbi:MAG: arylsulfatase [Opitutus sp.]|nr:arylsulfatase [Opitutus sp.]
MRTCPFVLTLGIIFGTAVAATAAESRAATPPNVIILFADDMGYADIGPFGGKAGITPNLDRMATTGRRFTNFHVAQAICSASRASLLTGCYANRVGITGALSSLATNGLAASETTLAEMLKARGYATGMAGKWHLGRQPQFLPVRHGFDEYLGLPYSNDMWPYNPAAAVINPPLPLIEGEKTLQIITTLVEQGTLTARYTERAVSFIDRHKAEPFFFYLAYTMPHVPISASPRFQGKTGQGLYADVIAEIDWSVGEVLAALQRNGLDERTLVIFTSDNGPWLIYGNHAGSAGPMREGKQTAWEGGLRVPCLMRWPGRIPAGTTSNDMLMTIDLLPTIAKLTNAKAPALPIDGLDVWPIIAGQPGAKNPHEAYAFYYAGDQLQAVATGDGRWKQIFPHGYNSPRQPGMDGVRGTNVPMQVERAALYDLTADIAETRDVAAEHPDIVRRLDTFAERMRGELGDSLQKRQGRAVRESDRVAPAK